MTGIHAFGLGTSSRSAAGAILDCYFPLPVRAPEAGLAALIGEHFQPGVSDVGPDQARPFVEAIEDGPLSTSMSALLDSDRPLTAVLLTQDDPVGSTAEAYLKLHLLSHRLALPNSQNLDGTFAHLPNVAWTSRGPIAIEELTDALTRARLAGEHLDVHAADKFPRMTNYVVPPGVRIADASRIRLGAYLGEGTTVMHEGFINFNAGALGPGMVEGRLSQGVVMGAHSDLGGGASTMGTLSGGGEIVITIGEHCLVGANAGCGIPLGDRCTIEAGLYITAGTPLTVVDEHGEEVARVKARELAGQSDMLFIRNGLTGQIQCRTNRKAIALNEALHAHN